MKNLSSSRNLKRFRAILITMAMVFATNIAISYADGAVTGNDQPAQIDLSSKATIAMSIEWATPRP